MKEWLGTEGYIPHGFCLAWEPDLMAAIVLSNGLIAIAYLAISAVLITKALEPEPVVPRWLYQAYAIFIFCCGISHVLDDVTLWYPIYRLQAIALTITAAVSLFTALLPLSIWVKHAAGRRLN